MAQLSIQLERKLGTAVERMPAFPKSVQKILELTRNINCLPKDLVAVIEKDPVMTLKILKVINSAYYGLPQKITSINQSVVYLGLNTIKNLALSFAAVGILPRMNAAGFDIQRYLLHSLATATVARILGTKFGAGEADPGDCYVAGLLHDFGKVVFAQFMPTEFREALLHSAANDLPLHLSEAEIIGTDHTVVGSMLVERWQFPAHLIECIRNHHAGEGGGEASPMLDCLRMADQIVRQAAIGDSGNPYRDDEPPVAPARFGGDHAQILAAVGDLGKIVDDAMAFAQVETAK